MGTRNLTIVKMNDEYRVAQYGQWDGYPSGNGLTILQFLRVTKMDAFRKQIAKTRFITDEEIKEKWVQAGANPDDKFVTLEVSNAFARFFPELSRDTGADILTVIAMSEKEEIGLQNSINFARESLFCEWAYIVDLDKNVLEVYKGFNKTPLTEEDTFYMNGYSDDGYYPVKLIASYDIDNLPTSENFVKECEKREEDDE